MARRPESNHADHPFDEGRSRRRRTSAERSKDDQAPAEQASTTQKTRTRRRLWPWFLLGLLVLIFFLPNIIAATSLKQKAIDYALKDFPGKVTVDSAKLGWLSPIKISGINAVDANGEPLLSVAEFSTSKSLSAMLLNSDYGQIDVLQPVVNVHLRPDGSNLEDALQPFLTTESDTESTKTIPKVKLTVSDGRVQITSSMHEEHWTVHGLNVTAETSAGTGPLNAIVDCRVQPSVGEAGSLTLNAQLDPGATELVGEDINAVIATQNFPLALAAPIAQRFIGPASTIGSVTSNLQVAARMSTQQIAVVVEQLDMIGAGIAAPQLIGQDQILTQTVQAKGRLNLSTTAVLAENFVVESDLGGLTAGGQFDLNQINTMVSNGQLLATPFQLDGKVDVARLARMLPNTLMLHDDLKFQSGQITFHASSRNETPDGVEGRKMILNAEASNIRATRGAQNIVWQKPLRMVSTIHQSKNGIRLEEVRCDSDFLTITGAGSIAEGKFKVDGDLSKLMTRASQFANLDGYQMAGILDGNFGWRIDTDPNSLAIQNRPIQMGGEFDVTNPILKAPGLPVWRPKHLNVIASGIGKAIDANQIRLDDGGTQIRIGQEKIIASLTGPVENLFTNQRWQFNTNLTGGLRAWLAHANNFVDLAEMANADGNIGVGCVTTYDGSTVRFNQIQYQIQQFAFDEYGLQVREPKITGNGNLVYDLESGITKIQNLTVNGASVIAKAENLTVGVSPNIQVHGPVEYRADMNQLAHWLQLSPSQDSIFWFGTADGNVQFASNENGIGGRVTTSVTNLVAATQERTAAPTRTAGVSQVSRVKPQLRWKEVFRDERVDLSTVMQLANDFNGISVKDLKVNSSSLAATANGTITDLTGRMITDLQGTWNPNWANVNGLIEAFAGKIINFSGQGQESYVIRGPVFPAPSPAGNPNVQSGFANASVSTQPSPYVDSELSVKTSLSWDQANLLAVPLGANKIEVDLAQQVANVSAKPVSFGGGLIQLSPQIDLRGSTPIMTFQRQTIMDQVTLTADTAREWMKFVAPLAADATAANGKFGVASDGIQIPLDDPTKMVARGTIQLSDVTLGAGPLAEQLLGTVVQLKQLLDPGSGETKDRTTWLKMSDQSIPFAVQDGRVYHENAKFNYKEFLIQTKGSVGMDQTINMVAEIPLLDKWLGDKPFLQALRGESLKIPISGTLTKPILDRRSIQQFSTDLVRKSAGGALNNVIGKELGGLQEKLNGKLNEKIGGSLGDVLNGAGGGLQQKLNDGVGDGLGNFLGGQLKQLGGQQPAAGTPSGQTPGGNIGQQLQDELRGKVQSGLQDLFKKK